MKIKKKAALAAVLFSTAMNLSACYDPYDPNDNIHYNVYGPPNFEEWEQEETDKETVSNDDTTQNEETTSFDPDENQNAGVYGPPEEEYEDTSQTEETSYDPADNINEDVYGPPIDE